MNESLKLAFERCMKIAPVSLEEFLDELLDRAPEELARMPGTPATVLAAQFTYYAKTSVTLSEGLRRDRRNAKSLADLIWRLSQRIEETPGNESRSNEKISANPKRGPSP